MPANTMAVENQGQNPLVGYNFILRVEGVYDLPCRKIYSFQKENEYEYIQEGGCNDYVHIRRKPVSKPFTFQVERYVGIDSFDPLPNGARLVLPLILLVSRMQKDFEKAKRAYVFTGCCIMGKSYGELDAEKSSLLIETSTIAYQEMTCVDVAADIPNKKWDFNGRDPEGNRERSAKRLEDYGILPTKQKEKRKWPIQSMVQSRDFLERI